MVVKTPVRLQLSAVECGVACLASILAYHGSWVPMGELRLACGSSRDGNRAANLITAAGQFGLEGRGFRHSITSVRDAPVPAIAHWNFRHFVVLEGFRGEQVYLNDPRWGRVRISLAEFEQAFTGVVLTFTPRAGYRPLARRPSGLIAIARRLSSSAAALAMLTAVGLLQVIPDLVPGVLAMLFVDEILVRRQGDWIPSLLAGIAALVVARSLLLRLQRHALLRMRTRLTVASSSAFVWHLLRLPVRFFELRALGELIDRVRMNDRVAGVLAGPVAEGALSLGSLMFFLAMMLLFDPLLSLGCVGSALATGGLLWLSARHRQAHSRRLVSARGKLIGASMSVLSRVESIKANAAEEGSFRGWAGQHACLVRAEQSSERAILLLSAAPPFLTSLTVAAVLCLGVTRVLSGHLTVGELVAFQAYTIGFLAPIAELVRSASAIFDARGELERLDDVLHHELDPIIAGEQGAAPSEPEPALWGQLEVNELVVRYSPHGPPAVGGLSLSVSPGDRLALVGPSGSGKSTAARALVGLLPPASGEVLIDGADAAALPRELLASARGYVDQDIFLFSGTIWDNLTLWDPMAREVDVIRAAEDACIHDVIMRLPGGYRFQLTEGGANLSGGERQRLELARALVPGPALLILDEATSALDPVTERAVMENLSRRGCALIVIAHRLSTVRDCDEIVVLDAGQVAERGTHPVLLSSGGLYARLLAQG